MNQNSTQSIAALESQSYKWLVTGAAGFIGSNLCFRLLSLGQTVVGLDNFSTGKRKNIADIQKEFGSTKSFSFIEGDICSEATCLAATQGVDFVLHQAALGSVPRSIAEPLNTHAANVDGFIKILTTAKQNGVKRFVYASSSSIYGDINQLPNQENKLGQPLSPYAASKRIDEIYAQTFAKSYGFETVGLRYFNVFGPRQSPDGPYAAVIPLWIEAIAKGEAVRVHGDGSTSRDFSYIDNVVQANLLACLAPAAKVSGQCLNIACGESTDLKQLRSLIQAAMNQLSQEILGKAAASERPPIYGPERPGDIKHSCADISLAKNLLGYDPQVSVTEGIQKTVSFYLRDLRTA